MNMAILAAMRNYRLDDNSESVPLHIIVTRAWKTRVTAYAKRHRITSSEAIRLLVGEGLARYERAQAKLQPPQSAA